MSWSGKSHLSYERPGGPTLCRNPRAIASSWTKDPKVAADLARFDADRIFCSRCLKRWKKATMIRGRRVLMEGDEQSTPTEPSEDSDRWTCSRCGRVGRMGVEVDDVPFHGYTLALCRKCHAAAQHSGECL